MSSASRSRRPSPDRPRVERCARGAGPRAGFTGVDKSLPHDGARRWLRSPLSDPSAPRLKGDRTDRPNAMHAPHHRPTRCRRLLEAMARLGYRFQRNRSATPCTDGISDPAAKGREARQRPRLVSRQSCEADRPHDDQRLANARRLRSCRRERRQRVRAPRRAHQDSRHPHLRRRLPRCLDAPPNAPPRRAIRATHSARSSVTWFLIW